MMPAVSSSGDSGDLVLPFERIGAGDLARVGGKGANLGELTRAGLRVPAGFCVATEAYRRFVAADPELETAVYARLDMIAPDDVEGARAAGADIRERLLRLPVPEAVETAVLDAWRELGEEGAYAVRSSATAEDLPGASFAGQQDTFLNVRGRTALVDALRRAWVSLFTDRAILYRARNGFDHRAVALSAVVQRMVVPEASGILFTADPLTGRRHVTSIDAGFGLGEALVSGIVSADLFLVDTRAGRILERRIADKALAIRPLAEGGTERVPLDATDRGRPALTDGQALALAVLGGRVQAHFGTPQDIEWAIDGAGTIFVVQSRPITSLYPVPAPPPPGSSATSDPRPPAPSATETATATDAPPSPPLTSPAAGGPPGPGTTLHVYASFGHAQVMTDPISPMGRSILRTFMPFGKRGRTEIENPWMSDAGGRLYVDLTPLLRVDPTRHAVLRMLRIVDPLIAGALGEVASRPEFSAGPRPIAAHEIVGGVLHWLGPVFARLQRRLWLADPAAGLEDVEIGCDAVVDRARERMAAAAPGAERIRAGRHALATALPPLLRLMPPVMGAGYAGRTILARLAGPRATPGDLEAIARGLEGNVTTEMDLAVGDLADAARRSPAVATRLAAGEPETAIVDIEALVGDPDDPGPAALAFLAEWRRFIERYGMRGPSEIDVARPRWADAPGSLVAMVAGAMRAEPGAHRAHQRRMALAGEAAGERLVAAADHGPLGPARARLARRCVRLVRQGVPVREHPKFAIVRVLGLVRGALLEAGAMLEADGRIEAAEDVFWLTLDEVLAGLETREGALVERGGRDGRGDRGDRDGRDSRDGRTGHDGRVAGDVPLDDRSGTLAAIVERRRADEWRFGALRPPRVITSDGEIPEVRHMGADLPAGALAGAAASAGVVEGVARVVLDPARTTLVPGEILVAPFTDPGWTPLFIHAAALVMEVGGLMTHGSVVAREYGIPAVVGVIDATARITTGQRVRVDGNRGFVEILDDGP